MAHSSINLVLVGVPCALESCTWRAVWVQCGGVRCLMEELPQDAGDTPRKRISPPTGDSLKGPGRVSVAPEGTPPRKWPREAAGRMLSVVHRLLGFRDEEHRVLAAPAILTQHKNATKLLRKTGAPKHGTAEIITNNTLEKSVKQ